MTLDQTYDTDNIFAKIIRGEMPSAKIAETEETLAFMDAFPQSEGHCLIIPKKAKATNLFDIEPNDLAAVIKETQRVAKAVKKALKPTGVRIIQFNGSDAGQTVFHIHFHVIPVYGETPIKPHAAGGPAESDVLQALAEKIAAAL